MEDLNSKFSTRAQEDLDLVSKARKGDQAAFGVLMERYRASVFYMMLKMVHNRDDADDLTQEAFAKAFNNLENYSADFAFTTWLFRVATNNGIDYLRKKRLQVTSLEETQDTDEGETPQMAVKDHSLDPEEHMMKEQRAQKIRVAVEKLPLKYKSLVEYRYLEELSYEEIAEKMDIPLGTVKAQLFRAKDMLYQALKGSVDKF